MDQFNVLTKLWPSGDSLDTGTDSNLVTVPATFDRHAANFVTSLNGTQNYQFLFWNTGRHVTNKRFVRWNFSVGGWGTWTGTKWYGTPGNGGPPAVRVDPFSIGGDALLSGTAIDAGASTFPAGAYPFNGDDHLINSAGGPVDVAAKDSLDFLQFAGWVQLIFGGDDSGMFVETDTGPSPGSPGFYPVGTGLFHVNAGNSAQLMALYGNSTRRHWTLVDIIAILQNLGPLSPVDPSPEDRVRLEIVERLLQRVREVGGGGERASTEFQRLIEAAPSMNAEELRLALKSVQNTVNLGNTAATVLQGALKKAGK